MDRIAELADTRNAVPAPDDTRVLYGEIRESAPVRRLVLDLFVWMKTDALVVGHEDSWDERFLRDLVVRVKKGRSGGGTTGVRGGEAPWRRDLCAYHEHGEGDVRCCQRGEK